MNIFSSGSDSDSDIELYLIACVMDEDDEQVNQQRRLLSRQPQRTSRPGMTWVCELISGHRLRMYEAIRFYPEIFNRLIEVIRQNNLLPAEGRTTHVPIEEYVAIFLTVVARNDSQRSASENFQHSLETINRHVRRVAKAISQIAPTVICPRNMTGVHPKIRHNTRFWPWFKDCIGAIDGTYIQGEVPSDKQQAYRNRKGNTSQNILCACDFDMRFTFIAAGWEGTVHDSRVLDSALADLAANFPVPPQDKYYIVDAGLQNTKGFLAPYKGIRYYLQEYRGSESEPRNAKELFNYRHSSLRNVIERTFGCWKSRFRILKQGMNQYELGTQVKIVIACAVLHNFLREHQNSDDIFTEYEDDDMVVDGSDEQPTQSSNVASSSRSADREMHDRREGLVHTMWEDYIKD